MSLTVQNLRAVGAGVEPASLLPGQICFNLTDKIIFVGDGSSTKTSFNGGSVVGVPGEGWYSMPMNTAGFGDQFVPNPAAYGDIPQDLQVLTWDETAGHPIWTYSGGSTGNTVYSTTNAAVAAAPGGTLTAKINAALGITSPDPNDFTLVTGDPGDSFQGLYYYTGVTWTKCAQYAFPSAAQVPYSNLASGLTANDVQEAVDELDVLVTAAQATADQAFADAAIAQQTANDALPKAGGTMTGNIVFADAGEGVIFNGGSQIFGISDSVSTTSSTTAASSTAVQSANNLAAAALPKSGGTMTGTIDANTVNILAPFSLTFDSGSNGTLSGVSSSTASTSTNIAANSAAVKTTYDYASTKLPLAGGTMTGSITFAAGQLFPISGIDIATTTQLGVVQIGNYLGITGGGLLSVNLATTGAPGVVQVGNYLSVNGSGVLSANLATTSAPGVIQVGTHLLVDGSGVLTVADATLSQPGVVQLDNTTSNTSVSIALTAAQGKNLQDQINTLTLAGSVTLAGSIDADTGLVSTVTTQGAAANFVVNQVLPAAAPDPSPPGNDNYYVLVTNPGTFTPPGGSPVTAENGDWILSDGTAWLYLGVGARPAYASDVSPGIVQLATITNTVDGLDNTLAITPLTLQAKVSDSTSTTCSNLIASSTAVKSAYDLANAALPKSGGTMTGNITFQDAGEGVVFNGGSQLFAVSDSTSTTSSTTAASSTAVKSAYDIGAAAIPCSVFTACGNLLVAGAGAAPTALPLGVNNQVLIVNTACPSGMEWVSNSPGDVSSVTGTAPIVVDNTDPQNPVVSIDAASTSACGAVLLNDSTSSSSITEAATANAVCQTYALAAAANTTANNAVPCASFTAVGDLLAGTGSGTYAALPLGTNSQVLIVDDTCSSGVKWGNACYVSSCCFTAKGQLIVGTGSQTYVALSPGSSGQVLVPNSACTNGVEWVTCQGISLCGYTCTASPFNTALGACAGDSIAGGVNNTMVGHNAGTAISIGTANTLVGANSGDALTTGGVNTALGFNALTSATTGGCNVAIGAGALSSSTTACCNIAVGYQALAANSSGVRNTVVGTTAGQSITTSSDNTIVGFAAGDSATGSNNTLVGSNAGNALTLGGTNILIGANAGDTITTGFNNTIIGDVNGSASLTDTAIIAAGTTVKFQANASGAWSYNGADFGTSGQVLASQGSGATPIWCTLNLACVPCAAYTAKGDIVIGTAASTFSALPVGTAGQVLAVNSACTTGVEWCTLSLACIPCSAFTAAGQLLAGTGSSTFTAVSPGTDGQFLVANAASTGGVCWATECFVNDACYTAKGVLLAGSGSGSFTALTAGSNNQILVADSACTAGLKWITSQGSFLCGYTCSATPFNTALGANAGDSITSGINNTSLGYNAGTAITAGNNNTYVGFGSGDAATSGDNNTGLGSNALGGGGTNNNTGIGTNTGVSLTTGSSNTFVGASAGDGATTADNSVAVGFNALGGAATAAGNVAVGANALAANTSGDNSVAIGFNAGAANTAGAQNVLVGTGAGQTTNATGLVFVGFCAGQANTTAGCGTYLGYTSGRNATGLSNAYVGALTGCAASNTSACGTLLGFCAGSSLTSGSGNTFIGFQAGRFITTGANNVAIGTAAFQTATGASGNVAIGCGALAGGITTSNSTAVGSRALANSTGIAINTAVGADAGAQTTGTANSYFGVNSGCAVTTGSGNTLLGRNAGCAITTGTNNIIVGSYVGTTTLSNNVVLSDGGGTIKLQVNENGAVGVGSTPSYGTSGQLLSSTGTGAAAAWTSSLPQVTAPTASTDAGVEGQIASNSTYFFMYTGGRWQRVAWDATVW